MKERIKRYSFIKGQNGFTLVELMVVLAILAILSSVAVFSIIGYIDQARFDKNEQNAQSMYQAVQGALERKKNSGEVEDWIVNELMAKGTQDPFDRGDDPNNDTDEAGNVADQCYDKATFDNFPRPENTVGDSVHMRYFLTYTKGGAGGDNVVIMDLVGRYFYDTTILDATFTIEFDVEKILGGDKETHYAVNTYAVFYDEKRTGWDEVSGTEVPWRDSAYRSKTSLVGYYNGGHPGAVDSVYTPIVNNKMTFVELALRNSEKLELSFSAVNDKTKVTGTGNVYVHYTASLYEQLSDSEEKWMADLVISEAYMGSGTPNGSKPVNWMDLKEAIPEAFQNGSIATAYVSDTGETWPVVLSYEHMTDNQNKPFTRIKASTETTALVYVNTKGHDNFDYNQLSANDLSGSGFYRFPVTVSYVIKKYSESDVREYVSYSIALDTMMSRSAAYWAEQTKDDKFLNYSIRRLVLPEATPKEGPAIIDPKNINVSMIVAEDAFTDPDLVQYNKPLNLPTSDVEKAKRAYDDPVYQLDNGDYAYRKSAALWDQYTGHAVCNTYFGDLGEGSSGNGSATEQHVCITAFRHLYNMRYTTRFAPTTEVTYSIERDLNWYQKVPDGYTSEVEVYDVVKENNKPARLTGHSPVRYSTGISDSLLIVSWPALPELAQNQILVAEENLISKAEGADHTSVIRNVQMRRQSFMPTDEAYGFICENKGTLCNIRGENFCLTLESVADGATDAKPVAATLQKLFENGNVTSDSFIERDKCKLEGNKEIKAAPIGALVGLQSGKMGRTGADIERKDNTIRISNPVVLAGLWDGNDWKKLRMYDRNQNDDSLQVVGIGGLAGYYSKDAESAGYIETCGNFAVAGAYYIGGVFGNVHGGVDAQIIVDSSIVAEDNAVTLPTNVNCLVMGRKFIGGAVGYAVDVYFAQKTPLVKTDYSCDDQGVVTIAEKPDATYGIDVRLAENSYIWQYGGYQSEAYEGIGGAVGQIYRHEADKILSIRTVNEGNILSSNSVNGRYLGGTVGYLQQGSAKEMYISALNTASGRIGTKDGSTVIGKSLSAAAGIACMKNFGAGTDEYVFNVTNVGSIFCHSNKNNKDVGVGAAIGAYLSASNGSAYPSVYIRAENAGKIQAENGLDNQTGDDYWKKANEYNYGVGGAIGYIYGLQNNSHIYSKQAENAVITATGNNVGGAIGCIRKEVKGSDGNILTVTAELNTNTMIESQGGINIGGCIGNLWNQSDYSVFRTQVKGNTTVYGYRNVGGVVGRDQQLGCSTGNVLGAGIVLQGDASAPKLTVLGAEKTGSIHKDNNTNIGGVIGVAGTYGGQYCTKIVCPDQNTEKLILAVSGSKQIGGLAGAFMLQDLQGAGQHHGTRPYTVGTDTYDIKVMLHPESTITGVNQRVGGAIGYLYDDGGTSDFAAHLSVNIPANNGTQVIKGTSYVGGAIGEVHTPNMTGEISATIQASNGVSGDGKVGGAIGGAAVQIAGGKISATIRAEQAVTSTGTYTGGCIGLLDGTAVYAKAEVVIDGTGIVDMSPIHGMKNYMGGCIGSIGEQNGPSVTDVSVTLNVIGKLISAPDTALSYIGGAVGGIRKGSVVNNITLTGDTVMLDLAKCDYVGGLVGQVCDSSKIGNLIGNVPMEISAHSYVGGLAGQIIDSYGISESGTGGIGLEARPISDGEGILPLSIRINGYDIAGGYVGSVKNTTLGTPAGDPEVYVAISKTNNQPCVGGFIGVADAAIIGVTGENFASTHILSVTSVANGSRTDGGCGGFIGMMQNEARVNCGVSVTLTSGNSIHGGFNTGGIIGYIKKGHLYGSMTTELAGGQVLGSCGSIGGVIGSYQEGKADVALTTHLTGTYSNADKMSTAIGGETRADLCKGIGSVIGQVGGENGTNSQDYRKSEVILGSVTLDLAGNLVIKSGTSSVGGLIGQCETELGIIGSMEIKGNGNVTIAPEKSSAYDLGGCVGYMFGVLKGTLTIGENVGITVQGEKYVGGIFGGMDGKLGTSESASILTVRGIQTVTGKGTGVGGVIGATGAFHGSGQIYSTINADLTGARITGKEGTGGVIGRVGVEKGEYDIVFQTSFYGGLNVTLADTTIEGTTNVGGLFGKIQKGYNWDDDRTLYLTVERNSSISATADKSTAGGMAGYNDAAFVSNTILKISDGAVLTISASNGYVGGLIGTNNYIFGNTQTNDVDLPEGGRIVTQGQYTGYVVGQNNTDGECGYIKVSGDDTDRKDGELTYHISAIDLGGKYDTTEPYYGFVGKNNRKKDSTGYAGIWQVIIEDGR